MFGSQALETAIGLAAMFFVLATTASAITEVGSKFIKKRARDLERGIGAILTDHPRGSDAYNEALKPFFQTAVWQSALRAAGRITRGGKAIEKTPSYLSATAFAEAVLEMCKEHGGTPDFPAALGARLETLKAEGRTDVVAVKAALESWFDDAMARVENAYKRWTTTILLAVGLFLAVALNASTLSVAAELWRDPVTRAAVTNAAAHQSKDQTLETTAQAAEKLKELRIPGGWTVEKWDRFLGKATSDPSDSGSTTPTQPSAMDTALYDATTVAGWVITALLLMLGAPFWFDLLSRLVSLRASGTKPPAAPNDPGSATSALQTVAQTAHEQALVRAIDPPRLRWFVRAPEPVAPATPNFFTLRVAGKSA